VVDQHGAFGRLDTQCQFRITERKGDQAFLVVADGQGGIEFPGQLA